MKGNDQPHALQPELQSIQESAKDPDMSPTKKLNESRDNSKYLLYNA